jgi:hypothetical protein
VDDDHLAFWQELTRDEKTLFMCLVGYALTTTRERDSDHWLPMALYHKLLVALGYEFFADAKNLNLLVAHQLRARGPSSRNRSARKSRRFPCLDCRQICY